MQIHDSVAGTQATLRKEEIQQEIAEQMEMGTEGLLDEDLWMLDDGRESWGHGDISWGTGGILASSHSSRKGGSYADKATDSTGTGGTYAKWAVKIFSLL